MTDSPLHVVFLWHMHQPLYKDPLSGYYRLPWARLHGTKDYLDMVEMIKDFPAVKQNYNLVPSLLEQLAEYAEGSAKDTFLELSLRSASELEEGEKLFILENFFLANWENMIKSFPRYAELLDKRGTHGAKSDFARALKYFNDADFRDLQVLFNLSWTDPLFRRQDPYLRMLCEKGRDFSEEDKEGLLSRQTEILKRIIPAYREMAGSGRAELSFSPFYHPILPLLCDTDIAGVSMPGARLPKRFSHSEDAEKQVKMGIEYFERVFGRRPSGMWPSEGSVSEAVLDIASRLGIRWVATDEGVLFNSLGRGFRDGYGNLPDPKLLYRPYAFHDVAMIFRDRQISDLIGFVYSGWDAKKAAGDLISRLLRIRSSLPMGRPALVPIILDGENAWEYYKDDGRDFFLYLFEGLSAEERLKSVTVSEFIDAYGKGDLLQRLHPGSWINSNFSIWIGHEEDNLSWDYLSETRDRLEEFERGNPGKKTGEAWKALYAAEGSDWNWWYGDDHVSETQEEFDELFRSHLMKVFRETGMEIPSHFFDPILRRDREITPTLLIRGFIYPTIDGLVTSYYEWYQGAQLDVKKSGGSMHKSQGLMSAIYFGFNKDYLFLRLDPTVPFVEFGDDVEMVIMTSAPSEMRITFPLRAEGRLSGELSTQEDAGWLKVKDIGEAAVRDIFELGVLFSDLRAREGDEIHLFITLTKGGAEIERAPWRGHITVTVPTEDFEAMMWY